MKKLLGLLALVFGLAIVPEAGAQSNTVRNMTENTSPATTYFLYCVHPSATPGDYKCTIANVLDTAIGSEVKFEAILGSDIVLEGEASVVTPAMLTTIDSPVDNECYSYDSATATGEWVTCGTGGGGGSVDIKVDDAAVISGATVFDFGLGFDVSESPATEGNIVLDYTEDPVNLSGSEVTGSLPISSLSGTEADLETVLSVGVVTVGDNATTATALAANGANCAANTFPLGVDASGAVESCTADDDEPDAGDFSNATDLDLNGLISDDTITPAKLDDDANVATADYFVVVETGAVSFDYLAELDSTHIADDGILAGDIGADDFGDFTCTAVNETCTLDAGVVDAAAIVASGVDSDEIAADAVDRSELDDDFASASIVAGAGGGAPDTLRFTWSAAFNWKVSAVDDDLFIETPTGLSEGWGALMICQPAGGNVGIATWDTEFDDSPPIHEGTNECTIYSLASHDGTNISVMSNRPEVCEPLVIGAKATNLATTDSTTFHIPAQYTLTNLFAYTELVDPTGDTIDIDIRDNHATSLLTTLLTIDATEDGSDTAATPFVFATDHTVAAHNSITADVQQVGSTLPGQELTVYVCFVD